MVVGAGQGRFVVVILLVSKKRKAREAGIVPAKIDFSAYRLIAQLLFRERFRKGTGNNMKHTASPRRCCGAAALCVVVFCWSAAVTPSQSLVSPRIVGLLQHPQRTTATAWTRSSYNQHQQQPDHPHLGGPSSTRRQSPTPHKDGLSRLYFFRRDNNNNSSIKDDEKNEEKTSFFDSIFNRGGGGADPQPDDESNNEKNPTTSVAEQPTARTTAVATAQLTPTEQAAKYLSDAERMRLEAERLDAALTLRLERELAAATFFCY